MGEFTVDTMIEAPTTAVWEVLADIGNIDRWNPGVVASHTTSDRPASLGATRFCDLGGKNYLDEAVVAWEPESRLTMRITDTNLPFHAADIRFRLKGENGRTHIAVSPQYVLKYGPMGALLDRLYVRRSYQKGMTALLAGLKAYVEDLPDRQHAAASDPD